MSNHDFANDIYDEHMGLMTSYRWAHDPRTVLFVLARYKFVAKMLEGYENVLEIGCADGFGSRIVSSAVKNLNAIDIDHQMIDSAISINKNIDNVEFFHSDMLDVIEIPSERYDALYALDVLEHVASSKEDEFLTQASTLAPVVIIGMPSLESQIYASPLSAANHINCKSAPDLKALMKKYFSHVFMFSMNDEVVSTGFHKLAHYIFAIGVR